MFWKHLLQRFEAVKVTIFPNSPPESFLTTKPDANLDVQGAYVIIVFQNSALIDLEPFTKG